MRDTLTAAIFPALGGVLVLGALIAYFRKNARLARYRRTTGTVVGYRVRTATRDGRRRTYHHPLVRFEVDGRAYTYESSVSTSQPRREVGSQVAILHDPTAPDQACIDELAEKHFVALLVGAIGACFMAVGAWLATQP